MVIYDPVMQNDEAEISSLAERLLGFRLASVAYHYLPATDEPPYEYLGSSDSFDSDIAAISFAMDNGKSQVVTWATIGETEGLSAPSGNGRYAGVASETVDMSVSPGWNRLVGQTIDSLGGAWHLAGESNGASLWALRLDFQSASAVIALGFADDEIEYVPDELVVIFDRARAVDYYPAHALTSSWGAALISS